MHRNETPTQWPRGVTLALGFECVLLEDCCAATMRAHHDAAVNMVKMQNGVFGAVSDSQALMKAIGAGSDG